VSIRIRSEGALESVEDAIRRYQKIEELLRFSVEEIHQELPSPAIDEAALAQLEKLDSEPVRTLNALRTRVAQTVREQLRKRDIEPTAIRVEDLLAQLVARAQAKRPGKPPRSPQANAALWAVVLLLLWFLVSVLIAYRTHN